MSDFDSLLNDCEFSLHKCFNDYVQGFLELSPSERADPDVRSAFAIIASASSKISKISIRRFNNA